jgi:hypothetical protein
MGRGNEDAEGPASENIFRLGILSEAVSAGVIGMACDLVFELRAEFISKV